MGDHRRQHRGTTHDRHHHVEKHEICPRLAQPSPSCPTISRDRHDYGSNATTLIDQHDGRIATSWVVRQGRIAERRRRHQTGAPGVARLLDQSSQRLARGQTAAGASVCTLGIIPVTAVGYWMKQKKDRPSERSDPEAKQAHRGRTARLHKPGYRMPVGDTTNSRPTEYVDRDVRFRDISKFFRR
jgi:hypothetical protein